MNYSGCASWQQHEQLQCNLSKDITETVLHCHFFRSVCNAYLIFHTVCYSLCLMYPRWLCLQPYSYNSFGGVMIPQMPMNYTQNAYGYQVHAHKHTPTHHQQYPTQGLPGTGTYSPTHMRWRALPALGPPATAFPTLHTPHLFCRSKSGFFCCPLLDSWPLSPNTQHIPPAWTVDQRTPPVNQVTLHSLGCRCQ